MRCFILTALFAVTSLACGPIEPEEVPEDLACGAAPAAFDPAGDVAYAVGQDGCARIERRALDDGSLAPARLVVHADGFSRRFDIDTEELTFEGVPGEREVVTAGDVTVTIEVDVCTGEWMVDVNEGEAILPVVG